MKATLSNVKYTFFTMKTFLLTTIWRTKQLDKLLSKAVRGVVLMLKPSEATENNEVHIPPELTQLVSDFEEILRWTPIFTT
jgi:hypothetical protein